MATEAQLKAQSNYQKKNVKTFSVKFFPADEEVYEWFQSRELKNKYIKELIKQDMEKNRQPRYMKKATTCADCGLVPKKN